MSDALPHRFSEHGRKRARTTDLGITLAALGCWGAAWFLPEGTYLASWFAKNRQYFPLGGDRVTLYLYDLDYANEFEKIQSLVDSIENQTDIVDDVDAWTTGFSNYVNGYLLPLNAEVKLPQLPLAEDSFQAKLSQFMFSPRGGKYRQSFSFNGTLECGQPAPDLVLSKITFR